MADPHRRGRGRRPFDRPGEPPLKPERRPAAAGQPFVAGSLPCAHYPDCVGCPLIGRPYGEQLQWKQEAVQRALAQYPSLGGVAVPEVIGSPRAFGYRNQVKLVVRKARRGRLLGVYRPGSHQVVDIRECPVHHVLITEVLSALGELLDTFDIEAYDERDGHGVLRYVLIRVGVWSKTVQVVFVTATESIPRGRDLAAALLRIPGVVGVVQNINPTRGNVILGGEYRALAGEETLLEKINGLKLVTHAGAFLQANTNIAGRIYRQAAEWAGLEADQVAVDLYCGAGALTFHLAGAGRLVVGVEQSPIAVTDAKANIRINGFHNVRFRAGDAGELLSQLLSELDRIDVISLNPPRKGADAAVRAAILAAAPQRILYVSCDPGTLARDLDELVTAGYRVTGFQPYDMLPQTEHVECLAALERGPAPAPPA